jgi:hypothetical protein
MPCSIHQLRIVPGDLPARSAHGKERAMQTRRRFKQTQPLLARLGAFAKLMREQAELPAGSERSDMLAKAQQADATAMMERWLSAHDLQPPK